MIPKLEMLLRHDPETGELWWISPGKGRQLNKPAGTITNGYRKIKLGYKSYFNHRLVWELYYKENPPEFLDHINRNPLDNRISNLRAATRAQNKLNSAHRRGISWNHTTARYIVHCCGKKLGHFNTYEEALHVRREYEKTYKLDQWVQGVD